MGGLGYVDAGDLAVRLGLERIADRLDVERRDEERLREDL
jgi:hypothetical protein